MKFYFKESVSLIFSEILLKREDSEKMLELVVENAKI
jgi:hypothetical protein